MMNLKKTTSSLTIFTIALAHAHASFTADFSSSSDLEGSFWSPNGQASAFQWESMNGGLVRLNAGSRQEIIFDSAASGAISNRAGTGGSNTDNAFTNFNLTVDSRVVNSSNNFGARLLVNDAESSGYTILMLGNGNVRLYDSDGDPSSGSLGTQIGTDQSLTDFSFNAANYYRLSVDVNTGASQVDFAVNVFDLGNSSSGAPVAIGSTLNFTDTTSPILSGGQVGATWNTGSNNQLWTGFSATAVPEPSAFGLILGIVAFGCIVNRRRSRNT